MWGPLQKNVPLLLDYLEATNLDAIQLGNLLSRRLDESSRKWIWFLSNGMRKRNYVFALEYTTNAGEKKIFPISLEESIPGVIFLPDYVFLGLYSSFDRIATLLHEATP